MLKDNCLNSPLHDDLVVQQPIITHNHCISIHVPDFLSQTLANLGNLNLR